MTMIILCIMLTFKFYHAIILLLNIERLVCMEKEKNTCRFSFFIIISIFLLISLFFLTRNVLSYTHNLESANVSNFTQALSLGESFSYWRLEFTSEGEYELLDYFENLIYKLKNVSSIEEANKIIDQMDTLINNYNNMKEFKQNLDSSFV